MGAAAPGGLGGNLVAAGLERLYDAGQEKLVELDRQASLSEDLDELETEFQLALQKQVQEITDGSLSDSLTDAVADWELIVHELYGIEGAAQDPESIGEQVDKRLMFEDEREVIEEIVEAWATVAAIELEDNPNIEQQLHEIVTDAYRASITDFADRISGENLGDAFEIEALHNIVGHLDELSAEYRAPKIYKSLNEFEQRFFRQMGYVPVAAKRDSERHLGEVTDYHVEDARDEIVRLLNDDVDVICILGEGGSGKSQLLAAVGETLDERDERDIFYVTDADTIKPPVLDNDSVLFVDDAGYKDMAYFIRRAAPSERNHANLNHTIQVVVAGRSVYEANITETLNELPELETAILRLEPFDKSRINKLLDNFGLDESTVETITKMADGNPFFAVMLGDIIKRSGAPEPDIRKAFEKVVGRIIETDIKTLDGASVDTRRLLKAMAVWHKYDEPEDADRLAEISPGLGHDFERRERLRELTGRQYLDRTSGRGLDETYSLQNDVIADYLRYEVLNSGAFREYARKAIDNKAPGIAAGLLHSMSSPVRVFFPAATMEMFHQQEWLLENVLEREFSDGYTFETASLYSFIRPDLVPHKQLVERFVHSEIKEELLPHIITLTHFNSSQDDNERQLRRINDWVRQLECTRIQSKEGTEQMAQILYNAVTAYANTGRFDSVEECLDRLETLGDDKFIQRQLANALTNAVRGYAEAERTESLQDCLDRFDNLFDGTHQATRLRKRFSEVLNNAVFGYAMTENFQEARECLDRLDSLYTDYRDPYVSKQLAKALSNAVAGYAMSERFDPMEACLDRLGAISENNPSAIIREYLASSLFNGFYGQMKAQQYEQIGGYLNKLEEFHDDYPEGPVREQLSRLYINGVIFCVKAEDIYSAEVYHDRLESLHTNYPDRVVREHLVHSLLLLSRLWATAGAVAAVERKIERLEVVVETHGECGGLESDEEFLRIINQQIWDLIEEDVELAIRLLDIVRTVTTESLWTQFQADFTLHLDKRFESGDISTASHQRIIDHLF